MSQPSEPKKSLMQGILDVVEKVGNMVPHPVIIFVILILIVIAIAHAMQLAGASVTTEVIVPDATGSTSAKKTGCGYG
jgi:aminobenzoyl-glutamate transport protein